VDKVHIVKDGCSPKIAVAGCATMKALINIPLRHHNLLAGKMKFPIWVIAIVLTALGGQGSAQALPSLVVYNDKATFLQETASVSASGKIPNIGAIDGGIKVLGSVKISLIPPSSRLYVGSGKGNEDFTSLTPGNDIAVSGSENLLFELKRPSYAFGFGLVEPSIDCRVAVCID
jgi:hypothetical protein